MGLRPGRTVRKKERPYTRVSHRVPRKSYAVGVPASRIHMFEMGTKGDYDTVINLVAKRTVQMRSNSLESARIVAHKFLEKKLGDNYFLKILTYPHHILREKSIATGAGADRYSRGMKLSFGRPSGVAVQIKKGQNIMRVYVMNQGLEIGKKALKKAGLKLSTPIRIEVKH